MPKQTVKPIDFVDKYYDAEYGKRYARSIPTLRFKRIV
jgi:hypothetical protein